MGFGEISSHGFGQRIWLKIVPFIIRLKNHSVHICNIGGKAPNNSIITSFFVYKLKNYVHQPNISKVILKHYIMSLFLSNFANVDMMIFGQMISGMYFSIWHKVALLKFFHFFYTSNLANKKYILILCKNLHFRKNG